MKIHYSLATLLPLLPLLLVMIPPVNLSANEIKTVASVEALSSSQLVAEVLQANPRLEVAQATWQASVASIEQQSALDDPQFQYSFAPLTVNSQKAGDQNLNFGQRFEISQRIPFPGKLHLRGKIAEYQAKTRQQDITTLQLLLATEAKSLFADWYFIHQAITINKTNQILLAEFRDIAETRYSTGLTSKQDVLRAEVEQVLLQHQAIALQRQHKTILAQLNTLLNRPVETSLPLPIKLAEINELPDFEQLQNKAMLSRPELKSSMANINVHITRTELTALDYYPDFKLSAGYNSFWDNEDKRFTLGASINIPLDQSKRRAAEQEAKANTQQAHWQKIDLEAEIRKELSIAYAYVEESQHVLRLYRQQLSPLAAENMAAAKADYQSGKGDFLTLISSEKNALQTQLQTEQALAEVHRRFAALEQAAGSLDSLLPANNTGSKVP